MTDLLTNTNPLSQMTWLDVYFAAGMEHFPALGKQAGFNVPLDKYPKLKALQARVFTNPGIKKHRETRPYSPI